MAGFIASSSSVNRKNVLFVKFHHSLESINFLLVLTVDEEIGHRPGLLLSFGGVAFRGKQRKWNGGSRGTFAPSIGEGHLSIGQKGDGGKEKQGKWKEKRRRKMGRWTRRRHWIGSKRTVWNKSAKSTASRRRLRKGNNVRAIQKMWFAECWQQNGGGFFLANAFKLFNDSYFLCKLATFGGINRKRRAIIPREPSFSQEDFFLI